MGVEIARLATSDTNSAPPNIIFPPGAGRAGYTAVRPSADGDDGDDLDEDIEMDESSAEHGGIQAASVLRLPHPYPHQQSSTDELAGIYLGVPNVYTTPPQLVGTFISWAVFTLPEPRRMNGNAESENGGLDLDKDSPNAIAVCLFVGACAALTVIEED